MTLKSGAFTKMNYLKPLRFVITGIISSKLVQKIIEPHCKYKAVVFMLHRFNIPGMGISGHDPEFLKKTIIYLKNNGFNIISIDKLVNIIRKIDEPVSNAVIFTIDDGFIDQAVISRDVIAHEEVPATICLVTEFISQKYWMAESRISYIFENTNIKEFKYNSYGYNVIANIEMMSDKSRERKKLIYYCKTQPLSRVEEIIDRLSEILDVRLPSTVPTKYSSFNWKEARDLEEIGITFCAHTCKHPALTAENYEYVKYEIEESLRQVRNNLNNPSNLLCYPTGAEGVDFDKREMQIAKSSGASGALAADPGYVDQIYTSVDLYSIPRFAFPDDTTELKEILYHVEYIKEVTRYLFNNILKAPSLTHRRYGSLTGFAKYYYYYFYYLFGRYNKFYNINWHKIKRLIFVCHGNICRSVIAEHYARELGLSTESYGLKCPDGDPPDKRILSIINKNSDSIVHRTRNISNYKQVEGDLIICMTPLHVKMLVRCGYIESNVTLLGLWNNQPNPYLHDPYSANNEYFKYCAQTIKNSVLNISNRLNNINIAS